MSADRLLPFVFEHLPVRGALVQLDAAWGEIVGAHDYPGPVAELLGQASAAAALIAHSLKFDGRLTLQLSGDGPVSLMVVQSTDELELRGMAQAQPALEPGSLAALTAPARCALTLETARRADRYQGIVDVTGETLAQCLEHYFDRSVQVESSFWLAADRRHAAGLLLQRLPESALELPEDDWRRLGLLAETLTLGELRGGAAMELLGHVFSEDDVRVFRARSPRFHCPCTRERAERALRILGRPEAEEALAEDGELVVTCEFCNRRRRFDAIDIARLFETSGQPGSDRVH